MAARVELGAGGELVGELEALVEQHPLREGLWASLITALYRAGRQADALAAYARVRRLLVDELGIEPGAGLRELEQQVLQQSPPRRRPSRGASDRAGEPAARPSSPWSAGPRTLSALTSAAGRAPAGDGRRGRPASGKTRLGDRGRLARLRPSGGVWLVRLDAVRRRPPAWRRWWPRRCTSPAASGRCVERLAGAETVLLLDNCEHVVEPWPVWSVAARRRPESARPGDQPGAARGGG